MTATLSRPDDRRTLLAAFLGVGALVLLSVFWVKPSDGDPNVFLVIANRIAAGQVPYRDFPLEYPPFALFPLALPRLMGSAASYMTLFSALALILTGATAAALAWLAERGWSINTPWVTVVAFAGLALAGAPSVVWRFDIFPALLTVLALVAVAARHPAWAGLALGLAAGVKLYPGFLVPIFVAYYLAERRWRSASLVAFGFGAAIVATLVQLFLVAGPDALTFLSYQEERGIEVESVIGGIALMADVIANVPTQVAFAFGSYEVSSSVVDALAVPGFLAQAGMLAALLVGGVVAIRRDLAERGRIRNQTLVAYIVATLLLVMLGNKVLSNQYICWLLPFAALLPLRQAALLLIAAALTTVVYPLNFKSLLYSDPLIVLTLNVRNALLLALFLWLVLERRSRRAGLERSDVREPAQ
jgi:hypothetical protein